MGTQRLSKKVVLICFILALLDKKIYPKQNYMDLIVLFNQIVISTLIEYRQIYEGQH